MDYGFCICIGPSNALKIKLAERAFMCISYIIDLQALHNEEEAFVTQQVLSENFQRSGKRYK